MSILLSVVFALLAAVANALSSVLQRKAARMAPPEQARGLRIVVEQLHNPVWFGGFGLMIVAFVLQATALGFGRLAVVQPVLAVELPFTLLLAARTFSRRIGRRTWIGIAAMVCGLATALAAAAPSAGRTEASAVSWAWCGGGALVAIAAVSTAGFATRGALRAALFGVSAGGLFGVTATFITTVLDRASHGSAALFGAWQLYALALAGIAAVVALQEAYGSGPLPYAQPGVTLIDPIVAVVLGALLFGERLRGGWLVPLEVAGALLIVAGAVELSRSPLASRTPTDEDAPPDPHANRDVSRSSA